MSTSNAQVIEALRTSRFTHSNEEELQRGIEQAFASAGIEAQREVRLSGRDRIDFLVGGIGVEVKVAGSAASAFRQLERYAESDLVEELVLVTDRAQVGAQPATVGGKPLTVVALLGGLS